MKICIMGLGYIGLPTAAMFASHGVSVIGVDTNPEIVETVCQGQIHIEEPGLAQVVGSCVEKGTLKAQVEPAGADVFIIAVPTPYCQNEEHSCDLHYVMEAVHRIVPYLEKGNTVIVESTIAPRSTEDFIKPVLEEAGFTIGTDLYLAHCPETVLPGQILREIKENNRIIGGITPACARKAAEVYRVFVEGEIICTEAGTAEMCKCMENTFRDVNIALANELEKICNAFKINCLDVIRLANKHPRVNIHQPGPGVGGHCLAIDPYFICAKAPGEAKLIRQSMEINESMPGYVAEKVKMLVKNVRDPKIALLGLAYKGNVDDVRESPALKVLQLLTEEGFCVTVYDPHVKKDSCSSLKEAAEQADLAVVLTDHNEFRSLPQKEMADCMRHPMIFDTRNIVKQEDGSGLTVIHYGNLYKFEP